MKTKIKENSKKGMSLIVLVITIIVMIILAAAVILSLSSNGIIDRANEAVRKTNKAQIETIAQTIWADGYLENKTDAQIKEEIIETIGKDEAKYYSIVVTGKGVAVDELTEDWMDSVSEIVNGIPVPRGFVVSPYNGENAPNQGLVIYALTEDEIEDGLYDIATKDKTQQVSLENRNQFVWVPVDRNTFSTKDTQFIRDRFGWDMDRYYGTTDNNDNWYSKTVEEGYFWEMELDDTNMPKATQNMSFMSDKTLKEVQAMYASIKKYGGFYIARYEVGGTEVEKTTNFVRGKTSVTMGKKPYNGVPWAASDTMNLDEDGAVELAREFYPETNTKYGVVSTLTYGVEWDRTVAWMKSIKGESFDVLKSEKYGNYSGGAFFLVETDFNENAQYASAQITTSEITGYYDIGDWENVTDLETISTNCIMTTGALKKANVCNIYDMAGNLFEWTMEGNFNNARVRRGGVFSSRGSGNPIVTREYSVPSEVYASYGFRPSLYIK